MASTYASLVSLMNVLNIIIHPKYPAASHLDKSQIKSFFTKINSLVDFLDTYSQRINKDLKTKMTNASFAAEDMIESYLVQYQKPASIAQETPCPLISQELDRAIQEMDLIIQEAMQAKENYSEQDQLLSRGLVPADVGSTTPVTRGDAVVKMVGLKEETIRLIYQLTSHLSNRHVIPIVGMGGLGKTTFAMNVYNHPPLRRRFDVKAWVTVTQVYTTRTIIAPLLRDIGIHYTDETNDEELGDKLYKGLFGRRYLIIIDDIWDVQAWYKIIRFCPNNNNGSRILLTTRLWDVANGVSSCSPFELQLLDADKSWDLLSKTVFEQEVCPPELENCGKEIAKNCKGLPLAIVVIGGLLKVSNRTLEHWEHVERNVRSIIGREDNEHCMKILSLSYHQLPIHLKPCFLFMASFPEAYKIKVSEVTKLWAAEGLLKPSVDGKTSDEVAFEYLIDLISRNLVIVSKRNKKEDIKLLTTHDLVRDLCIKEAQKEKFLCVDDGVVDLPNSVESQRRLVVHENGNRISRGMQQLGFCRSFLWFSKQHFPPKVSWLRFLRVYFSSEGQKCLVQDIMQFVNLRLLKFSIKENQLGLLSSIISWPLNLETLILDESPYDYRLPVEIWNLWRLKHLIFTTGTRVTLPDPPIGTESVLENLQTLKGVKVLSDIVLDRIPNIKTLAIYYFHDSNNNVEPPPRFVNFVHCHKLEKVKLWFQVYIPGSLKTGSLKTNKFPSYLRKMTLYGTRIPWENMTIVGSLRNLEYLNLGRDAFIGEEWKSVEGEFEKLTHLVISYSNLVTWIVEHYSHFPSLEELFLDHMYCLEEIPEVFGELSLLVSIRVKWCLDSVVVSAREILKEQHRGGNTDLVVEAGYCIPTSKRVKYT